MNTRDGNDLTNDELWILALEAGLSEEKLIAAAAKNDKYWMMRSWLLQETAQLRFEKMCKGELTCETKEWVAPPPREINIDPWFFENRKAS